MLSGLSTAQISEFSLILIALGLALGHLSQEIVSMVTIVGIITISGSAYLINYKDAIFNKIGKWFNIFERTNLIKEKSNLPNKMKNHAVLFGYHRLGYGIAERLHKLKMDEIIVDFDPEVIDELLVKKKKCMYGDMGDPEVLKRLHMRHAKIVISTVPSFSDNMILLHRLKEIRSKAIRVITAEQIDDALELYDAGADYVIVPHVLGGDHASVLIEEFAINPRKKNRVKTKHLKELLSKKKRGHHKNVKGHKGRIKLF